MGVLFPVSPLVSADWLMENRQHVTIFDCSVARSADVDGKTQFHSGYETFLARHLPGAQFADLFGAFSAHDAEFAFTAPDAEELSEALQSLGISPDSHIVVYDQLSGAYAARIWYVLFAVYGWENIRVLDGGMASWLKLEGETESGPAQMVARGTLRVKLTRPLLQTTAQVQYESNRPLLCALRHDVFQQGHIPGSINLPYPDLLTSEGLIDTGRVKSVLLELQIYPPQQLLLYCGGGINAAGLALALAAAGYPIDSLFLYDDSLNGWLSDSARSIITGFH